MQGSSWGRKLVQLIGVFTMLTVAGLIFALAVSSIASSDVSAAVVGSAVSKPANGSVGMWFWQNPVAQGTISDVNCPTITVCFGINNTQNMAYASTDGGNNWSLRPTTPGIEGGRAIVNISCPSTTTCFGVGDAGTLAVTTDSASTWTRQSTDTVTFPYLALLTIKRVDCPSITTCYAVANPYILSTRDGGATSWKVYYLTTGNFFDDISCPTVNTCIAVGENNTMLITTDGGTTWQPLSSGAAANTHFTLINCPSVSTCFVLGSPFLIYSTHDGGKTWGTDPPGISSGLTDMTCLNNLTCYAVGITRGIIMTTNGKDWVDVSPEPAPLYNITSISCPLQCVAATTNGQTLTNQLASLIVTSTTDNGSTATPGTLSYALNAAQAGQSVLLNVGSGSITLTGPLPPLKSGVKLGSSCASPVTLEANHLAGANLVLQGYNFVQGVKLHNATGPGLQANNTSKNNALRCTTVQR